MNGCLLSRRQEASDLGVTLDEGLNFYVQIDNTLIKAPKLLGFIIRQTRGCNDPLCLKSLFTGTIMRGVLLRGLLPTLCLSDQQK